MTDPDVVVVTGAGDASLRQSGAVSSVVYEEVKISNGFANWRLTEEDIQFASIVRDYNVVETADIFTTSNGASGAVATRRHREPVAIIV